jgi:FkbM family methyltransferase
MSTRLRYLYRAYRYRFRVDPAEIKFVRQSLRPGQVAVDVGCHKGAYTYWMRRSVGPSGSVYAFEPQPRQVAYLHAAFSAMRYDNVEIVPMAVSNRSGQMPLYMPDESTHAASLEVGCGRSPDRATVATAGLIESASGRASVGDCAGSGDPRTTLVDVTTLDDFFSEAERAYPPLPLGEGRGKGALGPRFLKIDVEGHELAVLQGARRTLEAHQPTILVECEARHRPDGDVRPVFDFLESFGYTGSFFQRDRRRPLKEFDPATHQSLGPNDDRLPDGYVNNFAFEP